MDTTQSRTRVVLVGCGAMSHVWFAAARTLGTVEFVGLVDLNEEAAHRRAVEFGLDRAVIGSSLDSVLAETRPDAMFDVTAPESHAEVTLTALAHGCHVLGEKPLAATMEKARRVTAAAQKAGKVYAITQNRRVDPNIARFRAFLASGRIGPVTTLHSDFFIGAHFGGFREHMPHVLLLDVAIHTFDAARYLLGADARAVYCTEWNPAGSWYDRGAAAVAIFEMSDGSIFTYRGSWCAEGLITSWDREWRAIGTLGSATWDGATGFRAAIRDEGEGLVRPPLPVEIPTLAGGNGTRIMPPSSRNFFAAFTRGNARNRLFGQHQEPRDGLRGHREFGMGREGRGP